MPVFLVYLDFWTFRPSPPLPRTLLFWTTSPPPQRGHSIVSFNSCRPVRNHWGIKMSPFRTQFNILEKEIFLERNARWKSCRSIGSVILQILIIPVKPAVLEGFSAPVWVCTSQAGPHACMSVRVSCVSDFALCRNANRWDICAHVP